LGRRLPACPYQSMKILALEDQKVAAMLLSALLKAMGHEVEMVADGASAWSKLVEGGHRVVVSDWHMTGLDGLDLCRMIRKRGGDYVYFILISSQKITPENRRLAIDAGVDDFLMKPVDPEELGMRLHVAARIIGLATQVKQLEAIIPICCYCKKIRDDHKFWNDIESYLAQQSGAQLSHGVCPDCHERVIVPQLQALGINPPAFIESRSPLPPKVARV
jgi:phosphoserine phosphatase RsbU/P